MSKESRCLFRFIHATDLHYEHGDVMQVAEANARIACLVSDIKKTYANNLLQFVLLTGDLTNKGAANKKELMEAKKLYDTLPVQYYVVAGNHDLAPNREFASAYPGKEDYHEGLIYTSNYAKVFGTMGIGFSFSVSGYQFIGISLRDGDPDGLIDWLEDNLQTTRAKVIVAAHYGLYPPRDSGPLYRWGFSRIGSVIPRLRSVIEKNKGKVALYLYGHNHVNSVIKKNAVYHISGGGIQKGCTGYRLFSCYEDRIEGEFRLLSDHTLHNFNYWGETTPETCVDSTHSDVTEYHLGNINEQSVIIKPNPEYCPGE